MNTAIHRHCSENYVMPVWMFISNSRKKKGSVRGGYCSTLIDYAAGQTTFSEGMSTMFREKSVVCGRTDRIHFENLPIGTILGQMPGLGDRDFDPMDVKKDTEFEVSHGGIITGKKYKDGQWFITIRQAMTLASGEGKIDESEYPVSDLSKWNVFMWDKRVMLDQYEYLVRETTDDDFIFN